MSNKQITVGVSTYCVGCGNCFGVGCAAGDWSEGDTYLPAFPFNQTCCPVCSETTVDDLTIEDLSNLGESVLRKALILAKQVKGITKDTLYKERDEVQNVNELDNLVEEVEIILGEDSDELSDITGEINQGRETLNRAKSKLLVIISNRRK